MLSNYDVFKLKDLHSILSGTQKKWMWSDQILFNFIAVVVLIMKILQLLFSKWIPEGTTSFKFMMDEERRKMLGNYVKGSPAETSGKIEYFPVFKSFAKCLRAMLNSELDPICQKCRYFVSSEQLINNLLNENNKKIQSLSPIKLWVYKKQRCRK